MVRYTILSFLLFFLAVYAWKDWYKALCGLIVMMAFIEHPDMPKTMLGIQGLNPWNMLLAVILMAWLINRRAEGLRWDMPRNVNILLIIYLAVILIGFFKMLGDRSGIEEFAILRGITSPSTSGLWSENIINTIKWVAPGLMLFDGCRSRSRFNWALLSILAVYILLAVQIIRWMPLGDLGSGSDFSERSLKILVNEIGYHRVNLAMMMSAAFWAMISARSIVTRPLHKTAMSAANAAILLALALTGGRTGYATWAALGMVFGLVKWKRYLALAPVFALAAILAVPEAMERMSQGIGGEMPRSRQEIGGATKLAGTSLDLYTITAGRNLAWPLVIAKIGEEPLFGYGREAMMRTGIASRLIMEYGEGEGFPHPHNAYLQWLLDNGIIGFIPVICFYLLMAKYSLSLFRDMRDTMYVASGGMALAIILALLIASMGSQTFYPREGAVAMWCAIGLMLRVYIERGRGKDLDVGRRRQMMKWDMSRSGLRAAVL